MSNVIVEYKKPQKVKTKVLSVRLSEKLLNDFENFRQEFENLTGCKFDTRLMISREIKNILKSFEENKNEK